MTMTKNSIERMIRCGKNASYNQDSKNAFHRAAMKLLKEVASFSSLGSADLRWNEGGIAVSGEATLHTDLVYIQIGMGCTRDLGVLVRTCKGRKDYTGGPNRWYTFERLTETGAQGLAAYATQLVASEQARMMKEKVL